MKPSRGSPIERVKITVACDVTNPLFGPSGAARVFGPQKGATPAQVRQLDDSMRALAQRLGRTSQATNPGAGAAGGLGFGMLAFFNATLKPGVDIVIEATGLRQRLAGADLCITGEGKLDAQSLSGKTPIGVARLCKELGVRCVAIVGATGDGAGAALAEGVTAIHSIQRPEISVEESMRGAQMLIAEAAAETIRSLAR